MYPTELHNFLKSLDAKSTILNFGNYDESLKQLAAMLRLDIAIDSCDIQYPEQETKNFILLDSQSVLIPMADHHYDAVVISHVIEHLHAPTENMKEWLRILKPGGLLYIEAPSEHSLICRSHPNYMRQGFFSFWDDPTHLRPWTPAAFYRLALGYGCVVVHSDYIGTLGDKLAYPFIWLWCLFTRDHHSLTHAHWRAKKFSCYAIIKKSQTELTPSQFKYITFRKHA